MIGLVQDISGVIMQSDWYATAFWHQYTPEQMRVFTEDAASHSQYRDNPSDLPDSPSCAGCGVCCYGYWVEVQNWETYVPHELIVEGSELADVLQSEALADQLKDSLLMIRGKDGACIALINGKCSIYANRPFCCRTYPVGGHRCLEKREQYGLIQIEAKAVTSLP